MAGVSRRRLLAAGGGAMIAGSVLTQVASAQADKPRRSPWALTFDIQLDPPAGMAPGTAPTAGAFYLSGSVFEGGALTGGVPAADARRVGTIRVWGWLFDPARPGPAGSVATATIELTGRGQFVLAGGLVAGRVAITAGTGEFRGANGQAEVITLSPMAERVILDYSEPYAGT